MIQIVTIFCPICLLKAKEIKAKINKCDLIRLKSFCRAKEATDKTKRQPIEWKKIFANDMTDKALISETYKQHIQLIRKKKNPSKKLAEDMNKHFSKKDIQLVNRYMRRCSRSLIIREMQMKTTMRYYFTRVRMAVIKKPTNNKCWPGCEEKRTLLHCGWECKLVQPLRKTV